jgi:hypothetical protein
MDFLYCDKFHGENGTALTTDGPIAYCGDGFFV